MKRIFPRYRWRWMDEVVGWFTKDEVIASVRSRRRLKQRLWSRRDGRNARRPDGTVFTYTKPAGHVMREHRGLRWLVGDIDLDSGSSVFERLFSHEGTRNSRMPLPDDAGGK